MKGYAQLKGRVKPKMCERGYAQNLSNNTGNSHKVKGYAQLNLAIWQYSKHSF